MKPSYYTLIASFAALAFTQTAAHAEEYEGVLQFQSSAVRAEVQAQAVDAAHAPNPYADAVSSVVAVAPITPRNRDVVRAEAVARAHQPNQNLRVEAFAGSRIPAYYNIDARPAVRQAQREGGTNVR